MASEIPLKNPSKRLGSILVEEGIITEGQLRESLEVKEKSGGFLGRILVEMGYVSEPVLITFLVKQCKIPHISLTDYEIGRDLLELVPKEVCIEHGLIPIDKLGRILTVAMVDPLDLTALERVREICPDLRIKPILCNWNHYDIVIRRLFPEDAQAAAEAPDETFGLLPQKAKPKKPAKASPKADAGGRSALAPTPDAMPKGALGDGLALSLEEVIAQIRARREPLEDSIPGSSDFLAMVQGSVRKAIEQAVAGLAERFRQLVEESEDGKLPVGAAELVEAVRDTFSQASEEVVGALLYQTQQALSQPETEAANLSVQDLALVLRSCMRQATREALVDVLIVTGSSFLKGSRHA